MNIYVSLGMQSFFFCSGGSYRAANQNKKVLGTAFLLEIEVFGGDNSEIGMQFFVCF